MSVARPAKKSKKAASSVLKSQGAIAVLTSGGDAPGMNACLRAVVRQGILRGFSVYGIYEGYEGLIANRIHRLNWSSVSGIIGLGGTVLGSARSKEFRTEAGMLRAAANLMRSGIDKLVVIGGDGSLSGAESLRSQWPELSRKLVAAGRIAPEIAARYPRLTISGTVGSIDNDMAETDMTIGADTALHRILDAIDAIVSTAFSHRRVFIIEVMGRNSGYLALCSAIAGSAVACFIPEAPPPENWADRLAESIAAGRKAGRRVNIIIVAEGARDRSNAPLSAATIQHALMARAKLEVRVTSLGHVQRGGRPSAYDRYTSTQFGMKAIDALLEKHTESQLVVMQHNRVALTGLTAAVHKTREIASAVAAGNYKRAKEARCANWSELVETFRTLSGFAPAKTRGTGRIAIMTAGRAAPGMNSVVQTAARVVMSSGYEAWGIDGGPSGLLEHRAHRMHWMDVELWNHAGGSTLGAGKVMPDLTRLPELAAEFAKWKFNGLLIVGDWFSYRFADLLIRAGERLPAFRIPIVVVPSSINNDLPGSEYSIGSDTALNTAVDAIDRIKDSTDTFKRTYIVETMGRNCGYLAAMAGMATGAEYVYTPEKGVTLEQLRHDIRELTAAFGSEDRHTGLIVRGEFADPIYTGAVMEALFEAEGAPVFDVRKVTLGPIQQGGAPTSFDRVMGARFGRFAANVLLKRAAAGETAAGYLRYENGNLRIGNWAKLELQPTLFAPVHQNPWWEAPTNAARQLALHLMTPDGDRQL